VRVWRCERRIAFVNYKSLGERHLIGQKFLRSTVEIAAFEPDVLEAAHRADDSHAQKASLKSRSESP